MEAGLVLGQARTLGAGLVVVEKYFLGLESFKIYLDFVVYGLSW